ncbi:hypothetical protein BVC93_10315 [Mycobacterium sp. MS1601]|uniref:C45 family autoproteolytic acyltransferase/hydolase n=1 Tax=Mycobacterium sp. MS1601 TaxID=1936029 RepID=UPI00097909C2|nr:C45 family peptidase [Mycobacterium sp. MS1601]AQA02764.1 hypothetical protein BVC93_10315 [Mycobacterium sp. MS1601]
MHTFTGDSYTRGLQHGIALAQAITRRIDESLPSRLDSAARGHIAQPWIDATEQLDIQLLQEMAGIAEGSGSSLVDVVLLNAFEAFDLAAMVEKGGCTAIAVTDQRGHTVLAQNWDANHQLGSSLSVHLHRDPVGTDVAVLASPGGLGWVGMNEHGLGLVNNDLLGGPTASTAPSQVIRRAVLKNTDATAAAAAMRAIAHPALRSYLLADRSGVIEGVEVLPYQEPATMEIPAAGIAHANHAISTPALYIEDRAAQERVYPSSAHRAERATLLLEQTRGNSDQNTRARRILGDHDGLPLSICRHNSPLESTCTAASVIFDCTALRAEFSLGLACTPGTSHTVDFTSHEPRST